MLEITVGKIYSVSCKKNVRIVFFSVSIIVMVKYFVSANLLEKNTVLVCI